MLFYILVVRLLLEYAHLCGCSITVYQSLLFPSYIMHCWHYAQWF